MTSLTDTQPRQVQLAKAVRHVTFWIGAVSLSLLAWMAVVRIIVALSER